ncbi:hypothetical protein GI364_24080 [Alicyclobacillus sp. SO9]|nr:hypothetical protein GI364_24080 [Alicyclobacillus sp. SO9]
MWETAEWGVGDRDQRDPYSRRPVGDRDHSDHYSLARVGIGSKGILNQLASRTNGLHLEYVRGPLGIELDIMVIGVNK